MAESDSGSDSIEQRVTRLVLEYAQTGPPGATATTAAAPLPTALSLRGDLGIDSLSLVSLTIRLGEEFKVDIVESGLEFGHLQTVDDLLVIARQLEARK